MRRALLRTLRLLPGLVLAAAPAFARPAPAQGVPAPAAGRGAAAVQAGGSWDGASDRWVPGLWSAVAWRSPAWKGLAAEMGGEMDARMLPNDDTALRLLGAGRLVAAAAGYEAWAGAGAGHAYAPAAGRPVNVLEIGGRRRWRGAGVYLSIRQTSVLGTAGSYRDSLLSAGNDTTPPVFGQVYVAGVPRLRYTDSEAGVEWASGRVRLALSGGLRVAVSTDAPNVRASRRDTWARAAGDVPLTSRMALQLALGRARGVPELGSRPGAFGSLALRWIPSGGRPRAALERAPRPEGGSAFSVAGAGPVRTVRVRVPGATSVELMADFTEWQPRAMQRATDADFWELRLPVFPGTYRVNLRVDGGPWGPPPGLLDVEDEFGGRVGLLVIP